MGGGGGGRMIQIIIKQVSGLGTTHFNLFIWQTFWEIYLFMCLFLCQDSKLSVIEAYKSTQ